MFKLSNIFKTFNIGTIKEKTNKTEEIASERNEAAVVSEEKEEKEEKIS